MSDNDTVAIPLRARNGSIRAYALVDHADADRARQWTWSLSTTRGQSYVVGSVRADGEARGRVTRLSRYLLGVGPEVTVSYRNHDHLDHRRANLRTLSPSEVGQHRRGATRRSTTGVRGVQVLSSGRYKAEVWHDHRRVWSGRFVTLEAARLAVESARLIYLPHA